MQKTIDQNPGDDVIGVLVTPGGHRGFTVMGGPALACKETQDIVRDYIMTVMKGKPH
jgi:hypothetical protein